MRGWRTAVLVACVVVALVTAWFAGAEAGGPSAAPPAGSVRLGPEAGEEVAAYLGRVPADLPPPGTSTLALVQYAEHLPAAGALAATAGTEAVTAVFQVPIRRVQTALAFEDLEPRVPAGAAIRSAQARAARAAAARETVGTDRQRAIAAAERAALDHPDCACVVAVLVRGDRAALEQVAAQPGVRAVHAAPAGTTRVELALAPLLPGQTERVDPLPDDGPVPP
ncbi:hypothetical protein SAMN05443637_11364 [Pseudonocardia thermophila]|uniref:Uncharacterized protein n=1 Tax=Pseudonocardia thermophila TaxID=1848 RepID=A0A1M6VUS9_PSETH|nr:hypothetical protein SAMN05443637_11364 [Pseudonocardia thermophila]